MVYMIATVEHGWTRFARAYTYVSRKLPARLTPKLSIRHLQPRLPALLPPPKPAPKVAPKYRETMVVMILMTMVMILMTMVMIPMTIVMIRCGLRCDFRCDLLRKNGIDNQCVMCQVWDVRVDVFSI